ncbi:hypothetical protein JCM11641_007286 [Rhodosporidiobolus odoratus]
MESPAYKHDGPAGRHRASSDPLSRSGAFLDGSGDLSAEPNPFEQSFRPGIGPPHPADGTASSHGGRRARSTSPSSLIPRATPGGTQKLPSMSFMDTPSAELSGFGWGESLRTGPLSPALLTGPQKASGTAPAASGEFDNAYRTGLTPLVNGAGGAPGPGVAFPPPSPATAALFAMMTNNTPGTADANAAAALAGGGPRPHEGANEGNAFEASFARANSGGIEHVQQGGPHVQTQPAPLNDLHRAALANAVGGMQTRGPGGAPPSHPGSGPAGFYPPLQQPSNGSYSYQVQHPTSHPSSRSHAAPPSAPYTAPPPQNSLDLLSQASFQNDDALVAAAALSGLATPGGGFPAAAVLAAANAGNPPPGVVHPGSTVVGGAGNGGTGHSNGGQVMEVSPSPSAGSSTTGRGKRNASSANVLQTSSASAGVATGKRARRTTAAAQEMEQQALLEEQQAQEVAAKKGPARRAKRGAAAAKKSEDDDDMDEMELLMGMGEDTAPMVQNGQAGKGGRGRKKDTGETEEEKRKNFLERNRQAALKCRQRKKAWLQSLQTKVELLTTDNDQLQSTVNNLKEEVNSLRAILAAHSNCPVAMQNAPPGIMPVGVHSHPHPHPHAQHSHGPPPTQMHMGGPPPGRRSSLPGPAIIAPAGVPPQGYGPPPPGARF